MDAYPRQESNLVLDLRTVVCERAHPKDECRDGKFLACQFGEKDSNLHKQLQRLPAYR